MNFKELKKSGLMKTIVNVGIFPEQVWRIKKLVKAKRYKSINQFVQNAVNEKLSKIAETTGSVEK